MKKSLHSSLQNQIRFTAVMVKKWGLSQSSFTSYRELAGHQSSSGQVPHRPGTGDSGLPGQHRHWHWAIQSNAAGAKGKRAGRELQGKPSTAPAYGCSFSKLDVWTEEISSKSDSRFWVSMLRGAQQVRDSTAQRAARPRSRTDLDVACGREWAWFESLCALYQPDLV